MEIVKRQWAIAKEMPGYDGEDWQALRKLIQEPKIPSANIIEFTIVNERKEHKAELKSRIEAFLKESLPSGANSNIVDLGDRFSINIYCMYPVTGEFISKFDDKLESVFSSPGRLPY